MTDAAAMNVCIECGAEMPRNTLGSGFCARCLFSLGLAQARHPSPELPEGIDIPNGPDAEEKRPPRRLGDYEILDEIARGGMGVVYRARQVTLNRIVAVKVLLAGQFASREQMLRFRAEAEAAASLQHPNIVSIHETAEQDGQPYFSMDYVAGKDLSALVREQPFPPRRAAQLVKTLAYAVHYAHEQGILHRDLKPSNVLMDETGTPRITDFGLARSINQESLLTITGQVLGSPCFLPPEQAGSKTRPGRYSDIYALGGILFYLLTGRPPFLAGSVPETLQMVLHVDPVSPRLLNSAVPMDLATICLKCLQKDFRLRYSTAVELAQDLEAFLDSRPVRARPVGLVSRSIRWCKRRPVVAFLIAVVHLVAAVGLGGILWQWRRADSHRDQLRQIVYAADSALAFEALASRDVGLARDLLGNYSKLPQGEDLRGWEWRYLQNATRGTEERVLHGHQHAVAGLVIEPNGQWLISASSDATVRLWNTTDWTSRRVLSVPLFEINGVALSPDSSKAVVWSTDGLVIVDLQSDETIAQRPGDYGDGCAAFVPDGSAVVAGNLEELGIWFFSSTNQNAFQVLPTATSPLAFSPDGRLLATRSGADAQLWSTDTWELIRTIHWAENTSSFGWKDMAFSPDGRLLAMGSAFGRVSVWTVSSGTLVAQFDTQAPSFITALQFSPDGSLLASAAGDQTVALWPTNDWNQLRLLQGHQSEVWAMAFTPDSRHLISGGKDETIRIWDLAQEPRRTAFSLLGEPVALLETSEECLTLQQQGTNTVLHRVSLNSGESTQVLCLTNHSGAAVRVSPDAQWLATRTRHGFLLRPIADLYAGRSLSVPEELADIHYWNFVDDSQHFFASSSSGTALWDLTGKSPPLFASVTNVIFVTGDVFCAERPGIFPDLILYDRRDGRQIATLTGHRNRIVAVASSPDGQLLGTGSWDSTVRIWELPHGRLLHVFRAGLQGIYAIQFSRDSRLLAAAGADETITLWHLPTARRLAAIKTGEPVIRRIFFENDTLAAWFPTSSSLRLWRAAATAP